MFYNRRAELEKLEKNKTALVRESLKNKPDPYLFAGEKDEAMLTEDT